MVLSGAEGCGREHQGPGGVLEGCAGRLALRDRIDAAVAALVSAARPDWPIRHDHCFLRVAYDNAAGAKWDTVVRPPAWRNLPEPVLADALRLLDKMGDPAVLRRLNDRSLALRGKSR